MARLVIYFEDPIFVVAFLLHEVEVHILLVEEIVHVMMCCSLFNIFFYL